MPTTKTRNEKLPSDSTNGSLADERDEADVAPASGVDMPRIERAVREILSAVGEDPDREGLQETPARVARMYAELFRGLHEDPRAHLKKFFTEQYDEVVLVRDISFNSMCEHHMLPFMGVAHIAYIPNGRVIGLSKLARVVEVVSKRPQVQERMTEEIANLLVDELDAKGVAVVVEASHSCMTIRGIRKPGSVCVN
jgi:GTP cyclohydrolase I